MLERGLCILVGYICGCFLTADLVVRYKLKQSAFDVGSHNPGMANVGSLLGVKWAAVVLFGDVLKTIVACELAYWVMAPSLGQIAVIYGGCGVLLGHDFPAWMRFRGGKGVTVTCSMLLLFDPVWGGISLLIGLATVVLTSQLCYGAVAISLAFCAFLFVFYGAGEVFAISVFVLVMMLFKHGGPCWRALHGQEPPTHVFFRKS